MSDDQETHLSQSGSVHRRTLIGATATVGLTAFMLPASAASASVGGDSVTFACVNRIPFIAQGSSTIVNGVTVTATVNSAVTTGFPGGGTTFLHQSNSRIKTVLTFSPIRVDFQLRTRNHADGESERYDFRWSKAGVTVRTDFITNEDTTRQYLIPAGFDTLTIDYTFPPGFNDTAYGSFLDMWIPGCPT